MVPIEGKIDKRFSGEGRVYKVYCWKSNTAYDDEEIPDAA